MKRYGIIVIFAAAFATLFGSLIAGATPTKVENSKHNLSSTPFAGQGPFKSDTVSGTTEICVFCHTPHSGNTDAPLWNRANVAGSYDKYASDVIVALGYDSNIESPAGSGALHVKTRICLSCHDGTIAMGQLLNLPYGLSQDIPIQGLADGKMPKQPAGYIGTNLRDDHPVAAKYVSGSAAGQDPELKSSIASINPGPGGPVWLYNASAGKNQDTTGNGYVECTSCHNPHDNQYGKFLVGSNTQSGLCLTCHDKNDFGSSAHNTSTVPYAPPTYAADASNPQNLGSNVGEVKCMNCHFPHKAATPPNQNPAVDTNTKAGYYLLSLSEEQSCFNTSNRWGQSGITACHGNTGGTPAARNIQSLVDETSGKFYKHRVADPIAAGRHAATEGQNFNNMSGWIGAGGANWHVECQDCHNPHAAGDVNHTSPLPAVDTITLGSPLYGAGGARVTSGIWPSAGTDPLYTNFSYIEPIGVVYNTTDFARNEYEVCFKCHSAFGWGTAANFPNLASLSGQKMTDQAKEFNPNNASFHPVAAANTKTSEGTYKNTWSSASQVMYCSDCHTVENGGSPQGPHGSNNKYILKYPFSYDDNYGLPTDPAQPSSDLCFDCHEPSVYLTPQQNDTTGNTGFKVNGGVNLHTRHAYLQRSGFTSTVNPYPYRCIDCHIRIPHGWWKRRALVVFQGDGAPYEVGTGLISAASSLPVTPGFYGSAKANNCSTANGCHQ